MNDLQIKLKSTINTRKRKTYATTEDATAAFVKSAIETQSNCFFGSQLLNPSGTESRMFGLATGLTIFTLNEIST